MERAGSGQGGEGGEALEQLRLIFNLCDRDRDGVISVEEFRQIGREHFDKTQPMEVLIRQIDPDGNGHITFSMFRDGIETYLTRSVRSRSTSESSSCIDAPSSPTTETSLLSEEAIAGDTVYPLFSTSHSSLFNNGYSNGSLPDCGLLSHSLSGDGEDDSTGTPLHSSPLPLRRQSLPTSSTARDSPSLLGRSLLARHNQLAIPGSPGSLSKCSTPVEMETDEMVSQLSDQLVDLSSKLEHLEEDHKSSHEVRARLRREKEELQARLEDYEDHICSTEQSSQRILQENTERYAASLTRLHRQSQAQLDDLNTQLLQSREEVSRLQLNEASLTTRLAAAQEQLEEYEGRVSVLEERGQEKEEEMRRGREQLRAERAQWHRERETHSQALREREARISQLQQACEEVRREKKRRSITASDMDTEVTRLTKDVEKLKRDNDQLQARFLQQGRELISQKVQSLADEMEDASKDDVMKALRDTEQHNARLHEYIEGLLVSIIDKHPELLEKR